MFTIGVTFLQFWLPGYWLLAIVYQLQKRILDCLQSIDLVISCTESNLVKVFTIGVTFYQVWLRGYWSMAIDLYIS